MFHYLIFKWFIPVVCDYNIKYQKISGGWVKHNTLLWCKVSQGRRHKYRFHTIPIPLYYILENDTKIVLRTSKSVATHLRIL